jgi:Tfp pilus assembly protein PilF
LADLKTTACREIQGAVALFSEIRIMSCVSAVMARPRAAARFQLGRTYLEARNYQEAYNLFFEAFQSGKVISNP